MIALPIPSVSVQGKKGRVITQAMTALSQASQNAVPVAAALRMANNVRAQTQGSNPRDGALLTRLENSLSAVNHRHERTIAHLEHRLATGSRTLPATDRRQVDQFVKAQSEARLTETVRLKAQLLDTQVDLAGERRLRVNDRAASLENVVERVVPRREIRQARDEPSDPLVKRLFQAIVTLGLAAAILPALRATGRVLTRRFWI